MRIVGRLVGGVVGSVVEAWLGALVRVEIRLLERDLGRIGLRVDESTERRSLIRLVRPGEWGGDRRAPEA